MEKGNWKKSPWTISIVSVLLGSLLTIGYDVLKDKPVLSTIGSIIIWFVKLLIAILTFKIAVWCILVAIAVILITLFIISKKQDNRDDLPFFYDYNEDAFRYWRWTWEWKFNSYKQGWEINKLRAHCPKCDTSLHDNSSIMGLSFSCPRCGTTFDKGNCDDPDNVESIIIDNVDRKKKELKKK